MDKITRYKLGPDIKVLQILGKSTYEIAEILTQQLHGRDKISQSTICRWLRTGAKQKPKRKRHHNRITALHPESFTETLHELLRDYGSDEVRNGVIAFTKEQDGQIKTVVRNWFGDPVICLGLLPYINELISPE